MVNEAGIRDFLINNLDIIEPDLKLVKKEFTLKNEFGAGGRIDILAKDKFGMFVIIEIKKSDKTAREAVQELCKYIALFKDEYGRAANKCRCILLSTEWHELLVPFSEFSRAVDYQVDGYQLILDEEGIPVRKKTIELAPEG
jgi:RecB family endonuclease NucS